MEITKSGSLCFWGDWFGRPMDNYHTVTSVDYNEHEHILVICFSEDERCMIYDPEGITNNQNKFSVARASKIVWEWYYYGREPKPENLCKRIYLFNSEEDVCAQYLASWEKCTKHLNAHDNLAFEIC